MRIAAFDQGKIGVVGKDDTVVDVTDLLQRYDPLGPEDLLPDLITHFDELRPELDRRVAAGGGTPLADVRAALAAHPAYEDHLPDGQLPRGNGSAAADPRPLLQVARRRSPGRGDTVLLPPHQADIFHHEAELAVVIGRDAKDLSEAEAMDAVFGYVAFNDVSARGLGRSGINSFLGKSFDTFAAFGPWIVTKDEIPDPQALQRDRRRQWGAPPGLLDKRHGAAGGGADDLHLLGHDAAPGRRHLLRHQPPGTRLDAGRGRGRHHGVGDRLVRRPCARTTTAGNGSAGSTAPPESG